jgi:F0F1-type ATP synthase membrane subunit b/b'
MWWWIGTGVVFVAMVVFWVWMAKHTDFGSRSRAFEEAEQEIAEALREAQRARDQGGIYGHR